MTEATNTKLMDTEAGGEQTQYEGIHTFVEPSKKSSGQLGNDSDKTEVANSAQTKGDKEERGAKTTENIKYGQNMSESGMGGKTEGMGGQARTGEEEEGESISARAAQGYGEGSGIGA